MYKTFTLKFIPYVSSVCFLNLSTCYKLRYNYNRWNARFCESINWER